MQREDKDFYQELNQKSRRQSFCSCWGLGLFFGFLLLIILIVFYLLLLK